jgi:hypothetical protein
VKASILIDMEKYLKAVKYLNKTLDYDENFYNNPYFTYARIIISLQLNTENIDVKGKVKIYDYIYSDAKYLMEEILKNKILGSNIDESLVDKESNNDFYSNLTKTFNKGIIFYKNHDSPLADTYIYSRNTSNTSGYLEKLIENGADVELFNDIPDKKDLKTVEDYEKAINEFHNLKGEEYFDEHMGDFWQIIETRPFIMWLLDYSTLLWEEDIDKEKSIDLLKYIIELNPRDNTESRNILMTRLLELNELEEFEEYIEENQLGAFSQYNKTLHAIKNRKDGIFISQILNEAINFNKHVLYYLTGKKEIPLQFPETYSYGDVNEAIYYSTIATKAWNNEKNAIKFLKDVLKDL